MSIDHKLFGAVTIMDQYIITALRDHGDSTSYRLAQLLSKPLNREVGTGEVHEACDDLQVRELIRGKSIQETALHWDVVWSLPPRD